MTSREFLKAGIICWDHVNEGFRFNADLLARMLSQEAEVKAATAQERERAIGERLSQTLSRVAVMEAQLSMLRAEQAQLTRSLEKERQRASESRQEYLAATELATTLEGRAKQLEDEFEEMRNRHKQELKEERARRHALEQVCSVP